MKCNKLKRYLRNVIRLILGTNANGFNKKQEEKLLKFLDKQTTKADTYVSDVQIGVDAKLIAMTVLAESIANDKVALNELRGK